MAKRQGASQTPPVTPELLETFRAYQRLGNYRWTAVELGLSVPQVKRRLMALYDELDITPHVGQTRALVASYLLRSSPY